MKIKAISLKQPWANLVMSGKKSLETRTWDTKYRGDIVICSSAIPKIEPYGCALGIAEIYKTEEMRPEHEKDACINIYPKAWVWYLRNIRVFGKPIPIKGSLGIFEVDLDL